MQGKYHVMPIKMTLLCLTACICQHLYAETGSTEPVLLPTLKIEATRTDTDWLQTPASVYRIDQKNNENNLGVNLSETLKGVPGLQLNNRENYAQDLQISMRGFGARSTFGVRGIRLYVDGIPATMPDGQGQTSNIDLSSLDHIEVLGGPFSSLYGNSSGGTILTSTKEGEGRDSIQLGYSGGGIIKVVQISSCKAGQIKPVNQVMSSVHLISIPMVTVTTVQHVKFSAMPN